VGGVEEKPEARNQKPEEKSEAKHQGNKRRNRPFARPDFVFDPSSGFCLLASAFAFSSGFWLLVSGLP